MPGDGKRVSFVNIAPRRRPRKEALEQLLADNIRRLFPEQESKADDTTSDSSLSEFLQFASKREFRNDPRSLIGEGELHSHVTMIRIHLKSFVKSDKFIVRVVHRFINSTKLIQRAYRSYLTRKHKAMDIVIKKWKAAESHSRNLIKKEIQLREYAYENMGLILVGDKRVFALRCLYQDCWTSPSMKRNTILQMWRDAACAFMKNYAEWKKLNKSVMQEVKQNQDEVAGMELAMFNNPEEKKKIHKAKMRAMQQYSGLMASPAFSQQFSPSEITMKQILAAMTKYINSKSLKKQRELKPERRWSVYYARLLNFNTRNVGDLINHYFILTGKFSKANNPSASTLGRSPRSICMTRDHYLLQHTKTSMHSPTTLTAAQREPQSPRKRPIKPSGGLLPKKKRQHTLQADSNWMLDDSQADRDRKVFCDKKLHPDKKPLVSATEKPLSPSPPADCVNKDLKVEEIFIRQFSPRPLSRGLRPQSAFSDYERVTLCGTLTCKKLNVGFHKNGMLYNTAAF